MHYQFKGYPFTLTFETIIELDEVLNMWWRNAPSEYQVCIEWLDLEKCKDAISRCTNGSNLMFFAFWLIYTRHFSSQKH
jgi:hypothetical protein